MKRAWIFVVMVLATASVLGSPTERLYVNLDRVIFDTAGIFI